MPKNRNGIGGNSGFNGTLTPPEAEAVKKALIEMEDSMTRVAGEKDHQKAVVDAIVEKIGMTPKLFKKMAKVYFNRSFDLEHQEQDDFERVYQTVVKA